MTLRNNPWQPTLPTIEKTTLLHAGFVNLIQDELTLPDQTPYKYYTIQTYAPAISILPITPAGHFVLLTPQELKKAIKSGVELDGILCSILYLNSIS